MHWTEELFVQHQELFLKSLEKQKPLAAGDIDRLIRLLAESGFTTIGSQKILDLACGIGRHSIQLARRGFRVAGCDISPLSTMIASDEAVKEGVADVTRFFIADMRKLSVFFGSTETFDGIINFWTAFGYYDEATNEDILRQCASVTRRGGFFAIDILNRDYIVREFRPQSIDRISGDLILFNERTFNLHTSRMKNMWRYYRAEEDRTLTFLGEVEIDHRLWSLHELIAMFERTGWTFVAAHPGFRDPEDTPLEKAHALLVIASRR